MSKLTLDEAIKHCLEVAEKNEISAITYKNCKEIKTNMYEKLTAEKAENDCRECAADHRQLAEWLTELKELREIVDACNILAVDGFAVVRLCKELKEAKRLLKMAMEDMKILYETGTDEGCIGIKFKWRYADEALKLLENEE